jgi:2-hydroxychromene-2-carboxylate isomerase
VTTAVLYLDLGSPYAYLAAARAGSLFGTVEFQPILLGAIFQQRGWGSWADTDARAAGMAEVEDRARRYGLPPIAWPVGWPANALAGDRAAIWAKQQGLGEPFIRELFRRQFAQGADIARVDVIRAAGEAVGLGGDDLLQAIQRPETKQALRRATEEAWKLGVRGVPSIKVDARVFYGDDQLEAASAAKLKQARSDGSRHGLESISRDSD